MTPTPTQMQMPMPIHTIQSSPDKYSIIFNFTHPFLWFYQCQIYKGHNYNCSISRNNFGQYIVNNIVAIDNTMLESLIDTYFPNNHLFMIPTLKQSFLQYNTKTRLIEKHITQQGIINMYCSYNDINVDIIHDYSKLITMYELHNKPIYSYFLPTIK